MMVSRLAIQRENLFVFEGRVWPGNRERVACGKPTPKDATDFHVIFTDQHAVFLSTLGDLAVLSRVNPRESVARVLGFG